MSFNKNTALQAWLPTISLGFAAFIFITTEMLPVGLLPDIALSMGKSEAQTGLLLTVYAWVVALMSLPLTVLTRHINRRTLVLILLAVFIAGNLFSSLAASFVLLMAARICIAFAHAVFWSIATPLAARAAPQGGEGRALGIIVTGTSLAAVLGVPLGTILGQYLGWRIAFIAVAAGACVVFATMLRLLPSSPAANSGSLKSLPEIVRNRSLMLTYALNTAVVLGHFNLITYFSPFMQQVGGFSPQSVAFLLLFLGLAGIVGGFLGSKYAERPGRLTMFLPLLCLGAVFVVFPKVVGLGFWVAGVFCFAWGVLVTFLNLSCQLKVLRLAPKSADVAISIYSATFNVGIGGGALIGSKIFAHLGVAVNPYASVVFIAVATFIILLPGMWQSVASSTN